VAGVSDAQPLYESALKLLQAGDRSAALALLARAIPEEGDFVEAHLAWAKALMPGPDYIAILDGLHELLQPAGYVEIGVEFATTLKLARPQTRALGIDPAPQVETPLTENISLYRQTSDDFFAENNLSNLLNGPFTFAFIDGLHIFEQVLRDFINLEKYAGPDSLILIHDCLPLDQRTASRTRTTQFWSGDVWKIVPCLKNERPDLQIATISTYPTGLCLIRGLDSGSRLLEENYSAIIERHIELEYDAIKDKGDYFSLITNDWSRIEDFLAGKPGDV
jgi:hypothetical protein